MNFVINSQADKMSELREGITFIHSQVHSPYQLVNNKIHTMRGTVETD